MIEDVKHIARHAGAMMLSGFDNIMEKTDVANIVTNKDIEIQAYIMEALHKCLPQATFIAEENDVFEECTEYQWIIDPIDGTTNFAYDAKHSAISIALLYQHDVIIGVCYNPYLDEMFYAQKGEGAFLNDTSIHVSNARLQRGLIFCGTSPYHKERAEKTFRNMCSLFQQARDIRRFGSAVLDICYIAAGRGDGFYEETLSPWDYAAASLILTEAGGSMHIINGTWGFEGTLGMLAGNAEIVNEMKCVLHK